MAKAICDTCKHAKLDEEWGEYKCLKLQRTIYKPDHVLKCFYYKEDKTKIKEEKTNDKD